MIRGLHAPLYDPTLWPAGRCAKRMAILLPSSASWSRPQARCPIRSF